MNPHLKTGLKIGVPIVVILLLIVAVPFLLPLETYRGAIERAASRTIGREVKLSGPMHLALFPDLGVSVANVTVANAPGAREPLMASVGSAVVAVKFGPLMSGRIQVSRLVLENPVVHMEIAKDGRPNWEFDTEKKPDNGKGGGIPENVGVWNIAIKGGQITYFDARDGSSRAISNADINLQILEGEFSGLNAPLTVTGKLAYNGHTLNIDGKIDQPGEVLKGNGTHAHVSFGSTIANMDFDGTFAKSGRIAGNLKMGAKSLREFASWAGHPLPIGNGFGLVALEGSVVMGDGVITLSGAQIAMDSMHISGNLSLDTNPDVPVAKAVIAIDRLDINPYLAPGASEDTLKAIRAKDAASPDTPLPLKGLNTVEADLKLNVGQLAVEDLKIDRTMITVALHKGVLNAKLDNIALYGGNGKGTLTVDASGEVPKIHNVMEVTGIRARPFLTDFMGIDRIEGIAAMQFDVTSQGDSEKAIVANLAGKGSSKFTDGAVRGADLSAVARVVQSVLTGAILDNAVGENAKTTFGQFGATFAISKGVLRTNDMKLTNPTVTMTGSGSVDLSAHTLDFHMVPKAGPRGNIPGLKLVDTGVPFNVKGPWNHLSYSPDVGGMAVGFVKGLGNAPVDVLKNPGQALQSLFGR